MRWCCCLALVVALGGCQKASDATQAKRMPQPPPAPAHELTVPDGLHIDVVIGGQSAPAIDAAKLRATPPDFADAERRAWKLSTLIGGGAATPGTQFVVSGAPSAQLVLTQPASATDAQPALMLNRRGDVIATMLTPNAPFPPFHGAGGRLGRPGDTTPHLPGVVRIVVAHSIK
jgi:hypothetical protein